jgi:hypothetical protein
MEGKSFNAGRSADSPLCCCQLRKDRSRLTVWSRKCRACCDEDHSAPKALVLYCNRTVVPRGAPPTATLGPLKGGPLSLQLSTDRSFERTCVGANLARSVWRPSFAVLLRAGHQWLIITLL